MVAAEKERIVTAAGARGSRVGGCPRRLGYQSSQLFRWRQELCERSELRPRSLRLRYAGAGIGAAPLSPRAGVIEIEFAAGGRMRITGVVDAADCDGADEGADEGQAAAMIPVPSGARVWLATGHTDMRKGFDGLALMVQETLRRDPHGGHLFVFRGRRGGLIKVLWHDGQGLCLFSKRLERGRFLWPSPADGVVTITPAQLGYLLEGIDWRMPQYTWRPQAAG